MGVEGVSAAVPSSESAAAAMATLDAFMEALNRDDERALNEALNFPHVRLASGHVTTWETRGSYRLADFLARAGDGWHESRWDERTVIQTGDVSGDDGVRLIQHSRAQFASRQLREASG